MSTAPVVVAPAASAATTHESLLQKIEGVFEKDGQKVLSVLEVAEKDFEKGLAFILKYAPAAETLAGFLFPGSIAATQEAVSVAGLLQSAILQAQSAYAASGISGETGTKKAADVIALVDTTVTTLLSKLGITATSEYLQNLIDAVVAYLKLQTVTTAA